jgi:hypothetical protein
MTTRKMTTDAGLALRQALLQAMMEHDPSPEEIYTLCREHAHARQHTRDVLDLVLVGVCGVTFSGLVERAGVELPPPDPWTAAAFLLDDDEEIEISD